MIMTTTTTIRTSESCKKKNATTLKHAAAVLAGLVLCVPLSRLKMMIGSRKSGSRLLRLSVHYWYTA